MTPATARNEQVVRLNWMKSSTASKLWLSSMTLTAASWNRMAAMGTPVFEVRVEDRRHRGCPPLGQGDRGPEQGLGAEGGAGPEPDRGAAHAPPRLAENLPAGHHRDVELARQLAHRRDPQEHPVEADIER